MKDSTLIEMLRRLLGLERKKEGKVEKKEYLKLEEHKGWFDDTAKHKMAAKKSWMTRLERKLEKIKKKKRKSKKDLLEAKKIRKKLRELRKELRKRKKLKIKKPKVSRERRKRRLKIRKKLEKKLIESEKKRKKKEELEKHGVLKVKEIETIEGREQIRVKEKPIDTRKFRLEEFRPRSEPFDRSEFYIRAPSRDLALMGRSLWARARAKRRPSQRLRELIRERSGRELSEARLRTVEERISELMQRYGLNERDIEKDLEKLDTHRLLQDFDKLINLVELERKTKKEIMYAPELIETGIPHFERQKERIKAIAKEIKKHRIITDADRVYAYVKKKGRTKSKEIAKELGIQKKKVEEYAEILAANNLIEVKYPPIGGLMLVLKEEKRVKK